jgi:hypothetical protein
MAFKTFAPGVLTSSDVNTFLMRQSAIVCTSSTRPASPNEGMTIYETDTDLIKVYSGTAWEDGFKIGQWVSFTPTILSTGAGTDWALGNATSYGFYQKVGRLVTGQLSITFGSTTTYGTKSIAVNFPLNSLSRGASGGQICGVVNAFDVSTANSYLGAALQSEGTPGFMRPSTLEVVGARVANNGIIDTRPFTWATGDELTISFSYEASA